MSIQEIIQRVWRRCDLFPGPAQWLRKTLLRLRGARIGRGTWLPRVCVPWPHQLSIGSRCTVESDVYFKHDGFWKPGPSIRIGDRVFIGCGTEFNIREGITIGDDCLIASGCTFIDSDHGTTPGQPMNVQQGRGSLIVIEDNVWLGAQCVVLKGVRLCSGAIIGAGSVVTKSIPPGEVWAGVPARRLRASETLLQPSQSNSQTTHS